MGRAWSETANGDNIQDSTCHDYAETNLHGQSHLLQWSNDQDWVEREGEVCEGTNTTLKEADLGCDRYETAVTFDSGVPQRCHGLALAEDQADLDHVDRRGGGADGVQKPLKASVDVHLETQQE